MKKLLTGLLLLGTLSSFASTIVCSQSDGDDRYDLAFDKKAQFMAIIHTNDSDESEVTFSDYATYSSSTKTISGGRYIVNIDGGYYEGESALYELEGEKEVELTDMLQCSERDDVDINSWVRSYLKK